MIVCENLVKIYKLGEIEVVALQGLDLQVEKGEMVGIVGVSGSGKTTLLNVLGGLDHPSAGRVMVNGQNLIKLSETELDRYRRSQVGFVWQQTSRNLIPYLTARENVALPLVLEGRSRAGQKRRASELLEVLGLASFSDHLPEQLSGGQQQRVALGVALANRPAILLADEPTGEVDSETAAQIYTALQEMNAAFGVTMVIVSHDPDLGHYTGRVVAIRDGKTSTETVRSVPGRDREGTTPPILDRPPGSAPPVHEPAFEERILLDKAGRLQIPRSHLEALNIGKRVRLERREDSLVIYPVAGHEREAPSSPAGVGPFPEEDPAQPPGSRKQKGVLARYWDMLKSLINSP